MRISGDQLARQPDSASAQAWLVTGDEPLLVGEAADAIRARARRAGFTERETYFVERGFDWSTLAGAGRALSLFAEKRVIEVRMPAPRPGVQGGKVLAELAADPGPDTMLLVITGRLEREGLASAWCKAFERHGTVVQIWPVEIDALPRWISARARDRGIDIDRDGSRLLAERVEGNLLAAHQEIEKLALTHGAGAIDEEGVATAVANSARYDVFQLGQAALAGDLPRGLRILEGLRAEGTEPTLVLWSLCRELRGLADVRSGRPPPGFGRMAERRGQLLRSAVERLQGRPFGPLFAEAARIDRSIKGLGPGDPWDGFALLMSRMAGVSLDLGRSA